MRPLAIDLFAGVGGWTDGLLAEGYEPIGFDIERHVYGEHRYPAQLVLQDVLTLHGSQFREAALIVASPPCQFFSYTAMPWTRAKKLAEDVRADPERLAKELALFNTCFRIQREACEAAGRHIPLVVENVRGAQPWVGRARWNFGSFYLWGDVPALMPAVFNAQKFNPDETKHGQGWFAIADSVNRGGRKGVPHRTSGHWTNPAEHEGRKHRGDWFRDPTCPSRQGGQVRLTTGPLVEGFRGVGGKSLIRNRSADPRPSHGNSPARKAASAMIACIPFPLAQHIARVYRPDTPQVTSLFGDL